MGAMERKYELCGPFLPRRHPSLKTSAEIVDEARRTLRAQSTQRPCTPRDGQRQLFARSSIRADHNSRPSSTFSLHAQNFDVSDSRPSSGTRLSPLEHKSKVAVLNKDEIPKSSPKPPTEPVDTKRGGLAGSRARLLRATSLTTLPPLAGHADAQERLKLGMSRKLPPAQSQVCGDHKEVSSVPHKPGPRRTQSERLAQANDDARVRTTEGGLEWRTDLGDGQNATSTGAESKWDRIAPLLQELKATAASGSSEASLERLCDLCANLHDALAEAGMLGHHGCKKRSTILRTLFQLIDLNSSRLDLHVAELCLALRVSGNNLLNICKLVFQTSRNESNDSLFQNNSVIDFLLGLLLREEVSTSGEALFYCVGTLKFLSGNAAIVRLLLDKNCMRVAQKFIRKLCTVDDAYFTMAGHIFVQLTAALRNLADQPEARPLFVSYALMSQLCLVLQRHRQDQDVCTNVSRIYSKLSSYAECRLSLAETPDCYQLFLELLSKHHHKQDLVVRLLFTLGNLTAKSDEARQQLFRCEDCVDTLLRLYDDYQLREDSPAPTAASVREGEDVLVKLVRVLANMCIHPDVGAALASNTTCIQLLMETLELRSVQESEELIVNVAATINNLTFYHKDSSVLKRSQLAIADCRTKKKQISTIQINVKNTFRNVVLKNPSVLFVLLVMWKLMLSSNMDAMLEATRVYGNLSQSKDVRDFIMQNEVHRFVVTLLDSKNPDVCFSACGVLTNLALDPPYRGSLSLEGASAKLTDCLRDFGAGDWQLAGQVCQALWNMTSGGSEKLLDTQEGRSLLEILTSYLAHCPSDEDKVLKWAGNKDVSGYHRESWELDFRPVAQKLLTEIVR
ncbi:armadillo repeat-containing protein 2 isoform X3 [Dunckerocampus dactyliophorus]|uniref:armadillo repeat-containing protein 2 isoform X3 n=1 Tax=Dunckerocampus dactyliophorus TaxID=161453 RepID=UPI0024049958|nr:armadillo repeat-containing protein 2 isoform X3 [Dunckerocampus dactyliophorus]